MNARAYLRHVFGLHVLLVVRTDAVDVLFQLACLCSEQHMPHATRDAHQQLGLPF